MQYLSNLSYRTRGVVLLIVAALVLPQVFAFIVNSFYQNGWVGDLAGFNDPTTFFGGILWSIHALGFGLAIAYLAMTSQWQTYSLGRLSAAIFAVVLPAAGFIGGWMIYDMGAYNQSYRTGPASLTSSWSFVTNYVLNDLSYWAGFVVTGLVALFISMALRSWLCGERDEQGMAAAGVVPIRGRGESLTEPVPQLVDEQETCQNRVV